MIEDVVQANELKIAALKGKKSLKIGFVVTLLSAWKLEPLLKRMEADFTFETSVVVARLARKNMLPRLADAEFAKAVEHFENRGGRTSVCTSRAEFDDFGPDIVFMTNPHNLVAAEFYDQIFIKYPCCYVPYSYEVSSFRRHQMVYNQPFHNMMWQIFTPHQVSQDLFKAHGARKGSQAKLTGYPALEEIVSPSAHEPITWKPQTKPKKRVIWAPHHTIDMPSLPYANFLKIGDDIRKIASEFSDEIQWAFKPHPLLQSKLFKHADWGRKRTRQYYNYWSNSEHTQYEMGKYETLFRQSDAMIHDSGSFTAEYPLLEKPVMFLWNSSSIPQYFTLFGQEALFANERGANLEDVRFFLEDLIADRNPGHERRAAFLKKYPVKVNEKFPSENIISELKSVL